MNAVNDIYSIDYQNDASSSYMVLKLREPEKLIDYQIKIIKDNPMQNLLTPYRKQFDNEVFIYYDITSRITLEQFLSRRKLSRHEILTIINSIIKGLQIAKRYLLHGGQYILDVGYIYINPLSMEASLAYIPIDIQGDVKEELRTFLIELVVYKTLFINAEEGSFVYRLLNLLKSEAFSLEQIDKLVYDIAVEADVAKDEGIRKSQAKEQVADETCTTRNEIETRKLHEKQTPKASFHNRKLYLTILIQFVFAAIALLMVRLLIMENQGLDIYSATGGALLLLSADFMIMKKLGLLNKSEDKTINNEAAANAITDYSSFEKKNNRGARKQTNNMVIWDNIRLKTSLEMETSVLENQEIPYACLIGCGDNIHEKIIIDKASFMIGRLKSQVDYVSQNNAVGKVHAEIINRNGMNYIKDLNSRNGTYINGERIVSNVEYTIKNSDRVAFANSEYTFAWTGGAS